MQRKLFLTICASFTCCLLAATIAVRAQVARSDSSEVLRQLLSMPAPTPRVKTEAAKLAEEETIRVQRLDALAQPPPETAPLEDLLGYWGRRISNVSRFGLQPSPKVRERVLDAFEAAPENLSHIMSLLPETEEAAERVKKIYDAAINTAQFDETWQENVRQWLKFNSTYFLSDLQALARKVKEKDGYIDNEDALTSLARVDWSSAEPLLQTLAEGGQTRLSTLALALSYRHALKAKEESAEEKYRARLQAIAADPNFRSDARNTAIQELSLSEWSGRDEWYLSLFADETLLQPSDLNIGFTPLTVLFDSDPDKWIPVMIKLVESKNRAIQQAAASCLVHYAVERPRRDAILPVLRWLSDPDWLNINNIYRTFFIQKMAAFDIPESVPGLIWIVENDKDNGQWAAQTLARYKDPRAVPALKRALEQASYEDFRHMILEGLIASGGIPEAEQIAGLEAYADKLTTSEGRAEVERYRSLGDEALPMPVSIGKYLAGQTNAPEGLVPALLLRVEDLQKKRPELARTLLEIAQKWQGRQIELDMLRRIASGTADAQMIANLLERRDKLRASLNAELQSMVATGGAARGVAAVLLNDEPLAQSVLGSDDTVAQVMLLGCARLVQMPLPVSQVGALFQSKNPNVALAAERYLLAEDSREARGLLWARHENEAFITGWRENIPLIGGDNFEAMGKAEEKLRAELFTDSAPLEIISILRDTQQPYHIVRVYVDKAVYTHNEDDARYRVRVITKEELAQLKNFIKTSKLTDSGPQINYCHHDCVVSEFLSLTKRSGRRVFSHQSVSGWQELLSHFELMGKGEGAQIHYHLEKEIKGLEILLADQSLSVKDVWQRGADLRVFIERPETPDEAEPPQGSDVPDEDIDEAEAEAARLKQQRQQAARDRERFSWRALTNGKPSANAPQPEGYSTFDASAFEIDNEDDELEASGAFETAEGRTLVFAGNFTKGGLWKKSAGHKAVPIKEEDKYSNVVVTPDGKWAIAAKTEEHWGEPNYVVRVNLQTNREYRVKLQPADEFEPVAYLATHGKVLLRRARDEYNTDPKSTSPATPEFYLLDAATGETQLVTGIFTPLQEEGKRFLQPTAKPAEFWAAIPDRSNNQTRVGRYNVRDFSFQTLLTVPHLVFDSHTMWVDEAGAKLYVVYEGQLLRLPLRAIP